MITVQADSKAGEHDVLDDNAKVLDISHDEVSLSVMRCVIVLASDSLCATI